MKLLLVALLACSACSTPDTGPSYKSPDGGKWQEVNTKQQELCVSASAKAVWDHLGPNATPEILQWAYQECLKQNKVAI